MMTIVTVVSSYKMAHWSISPGLVQVVMEVPRGRIGEKLKVRIRACLDKHCTGARERDTLLPEAPNNFGRKENSLPAVASSELDRVNDIGL